MRELTWLAGVLLRIAWIALALIIAYASLLGTSMSFVSPIGIILLLGAVVTMCPIAILTYFWTPPAERQALRRWVVPSVLGWVTAIAMYFVFTKMLGLTATRTGAIVAIVLPIVLLAPFYCYLAVWSAIRIGTVSPPAPENGANINATDWRKQKALQWALKESKDDIVAFLRATYPDAR